MVWEGYTSRVCKCNDFSTNGLFGRDKCFLPFRRTVQARREICGGRDAIPEEIGNRRESIGTSEQSSERYAGWFSNGIPRPGQDFRSQATACSRGGDPPEF